MASVGLVRSDIYRRHLTGDHPEQSARLQAIDKRLEATGMLQDVVALTPKAAGREDILRAHDEAHWKSVEGVRGRGPGSFDPDTVYSPESADVALLAAGGVVTAVQHAIAGDVDRALVLPRPPGHHATRSRPMGFCLYNNVAIGAAFLRQHYELDRVAIIDFDVHHGNGTQDIFYEDPGTFFFSIHQSGIFPNSGFAEEKGSGKGVGTTLNVPLPAGTERREYMEAYMKALDEVFAFRPQFVLISAGFDAHQMDPLAMMSLRSEDFHLMTRQIVERSTAAGVMGIVSVLEGGYNLAALAESVEHHLRALILP